MPLITDVLKDTERKKKFQKTAYRPWDDDLTVRIDPSNSADTIAYQQNKELEDIKNKKIISLPTQAITFENKEVDDGIDMEKCLRDLYGAHRIIFKLLIQLPVQKRESFFITDPISTNEIAEPTRLPINTIKTVISRLKTKNLLSTYENKPGRGGYGRYSFSKEVYEFFTEKFKA